MVMTWLRRNPRRAVLAFATALMALVLAVVAHTNGDSTADTPPVASTTPGEKTSDTPGAPQSSQSVPEAPPLTAPAATPDPHGEHHQPDARPVQKTAVSYLATFLDGAIAETVWRARLNALSTSTHRQTLVTVPRAAVPHAGLRSVTVTRLASGAATATAVLTDQTVLIVGMVLDADGWKVSRVVPQTVRR